MRNLWSRLVHPYENGDCHTNGCERQAAAGPLCGYCAECLDAQRPYGTCATDGCDRPCKYEGDTTCTACQGARIDEARRAKYGTCIIGGCDEPCICPGDTVCAAHREQGIYLGGLDEPLYHRAVAIDSFASDMLMFGHALPIIAVVSYFLFGEVVHFPTSIAGYEVVFLGGVAVMVVLMLVAKVLWSHAKDLRRQAIAGGRRS